MLHHPELVGEEGSLPAEEAEEAVEAVEADEAEAVEAPDVAPDVEASPAAVVAPAGRNGDIETEHLKLLTETRVKN